LGFQLSFAATAGIIYLTPPAITGWFRRTGLAGWLATAVAVSSGSVA
jgi:predicted membrane metal-binding protein